MVQGVFLLLLIDFFSDLYLHYPSFIVPKRAFLDWFRSRISTRQMFDTVHAVSSRNATKIL